MRALLTRRAPDLTLFKRRAIGFRDLGFGAGVLGLVLGGLAG